MDINNLTSVYNQNPTLQGQYTLQQYLDLFGQNNTTQPDPNPDPDPDPNPDPDPTPPNQGIIGADMDRGGGGVQSLQSTYSTSPGDPKNYRLSQLEGTPDYFPPTTMMGKTTNFLKELSPPKVRGELGNRLQKQYEFGQKLPSFITKIASMQNPFNPDSKNYNRNMASQLNYLEGMDGTKLSGDNALKKNGKYGLIEGQAMIGRDQNSGALKYGPGTVLEGKNVISGFGSNDYLTALDKYIDKMTNRGTKGGIYNESNLTPYQLEKLKKANLEKQGYFDTSFKNEQEKQRQIEEEKFQATLEREQRRQRQNDLDTVASAYDRFSRGDDSAYSSGAAGVQRDSGGNEVGYNDPFDPGGGEKDGGYIDGTNRRKTNYFKGGIVSLRRK